MTICARLIYFFLRQLDICIPVRMDRMFKSNPEMFCYICSNVVLPNCQTKATDFVKKPYHDYFGVKIGDQDKTFTPLVSHKTCVENLMDWRNGKRKSMPFSMVGTIFLHD